MFERATPSRATLLSPDDYGAAVVMAAILPDDADLSDEIGLIQRLAGAFEPSRIAALLPVVIAKAQEFRASFSRETGEGGPTKSARMRVLAAPALVAATVALSPSAAAAATLCDRFAQSHWNEPSAILAVLLLNGALAAMLIAGQMRRRRRAAREAMIAERLRAWREACPEQTQDETARDAERHAKSRIAAMGAHSSFAVEDTGSDLTAITMGEPITPPCSETDMWRRCAARARLAARRTA